MCLDVVGECTAAQSVVALYSVVRAEPVGGMFSLQQLGNKSDAHMVSMRIWCALYVHRMSLILRVGMY